MASHLPPLAAIRVFEAAARHQNFTRAAEELGMSQASVSYQIKLLEERVGARLFLRKPRKVTLSHEGRRLAAPTIEAFERLRAAYAPVDPARQSTLAISTTPTFAANWLAARLGRFQMAHPNLAVRMDAQEQYVDFAREEVDVAIRYGNGTWPGLASHRLIDVSFTVMASPALLERFGALSEPADVLKLPLINPTDRYWALWLKAAGLPTEHLTSRVGTDLGSQTNEARAVMSGQGVAVLSTRFFRYELETGRLVTPFDLVCTDGMAHWLVYPEARRTVPKIRAFRRWLAEEVAEDEAGGD